jgi:hypothetical protein
MWYKNVEMKPEEACSRSLREVLTVRITSAAESTFKPIDEANSNST